MRSKANDASKGGTLTLTAHGLTIGPRLSEFQRNTQCCCVNICMSTCTPTLCSLFISGSFVTQVLQRNCAHLTHLPSNTRYSPTTGKGSANASPPIPLRERSYGQMHPGYFWAKIFLTAVGTVSGHFVRQPAQELLKAA